ncbi:LysR family transcriptional regulator [Pigmentiphaga litoralis]|uniref:DNA-binding transcriptional LysR family regulator n=1 Tax=Pigmentiphaga litoralis TaxID=516702 RepID=A0A7Y9IWC0_9BURK|nr:LysR family transcriptional regulator [Pigmentiphaga litoralis]NYE22095.1 DNA-binding transcriptional LysR family regulator [Pigmentiphaga litoralis]NYE84290.1 DNA-binding transcriptional LysR family regulator [Pigmentiphaga litoralis]
MDRWTQTRLYVGIARLGSISKAADDLELSNAAASRYLNDLERRVGVRLVERTTRRLWLTEAGTTYLRYCEAAVSALDEGDAAISDASVEPMGELRVTTSVSFAVNHIAPRLAEFSKRYPKLKIKLLVENRYQSFIEAGTDVAIRTRQFEPDSGITVRRLADTRLVIAAAPAYLAERGTPSSVEDLARHRLLLYTLATTTSELHLRRGAEQRRLPVEGAFESNDGQVIRTAAINGAGVLIQPQYIVDTDIREGRLVALFEDWDLPMLTINLAYQSKLLQPAKIRAFTQFMIESLASCDLTSRFNRRG